MAAAELVILPGLIAIGIFFQKLKQKVDFIKKEKVITVKPKKAFTIPEVVTVAAIIAILVAILIPSLAAVRRIAKKTQQQSQLTTMALAITTFKNDYGDYPPSSAKDEADEDYTGAQKLAEALVGWDLLGFHPDSDFRSDGKSNDDSEDIYPPPPLDPTDDDDKQNLRERKGPYLELATADVFKVGDLFNDTDDLEENTYVICDVYGIRRVPISGSKMVKAGTPILYYKANPSAKNHDSANDHSQRIYDVYNNKFLVDLKTLTPDGSAGEDHPLGEDLQTFYDFIRDPKVTTAPWPYRPDSYILISAGADGEYGTGDDVCNF